MFTKIITESPLVTETANAYFSNITGDFLRGDVSFLATLRALMHKRVPSEESIRLAVSSSDHDSSAIRNSSRKDVMGALLRHMLLKSSINIHSLNGSGDDTTACLEKIDDCGLDDIEKGFKPMPDLEKFFEQKKIRARFFVNDDRTCAVIFIEHLDLKKWHLLQSFIPRYFSKYFTDMPLDENELKLLKSLTGRYAPTYEKLIAEASKQFDFRTAFIRKMLSGFESAFDRRALSDVRCNIRTYRDKIDSLNRSFSEYYQQIQALTTTEVGLIEKIRNGRKEDSELLEYFLCNKALNLVKATDSMIEFVVTTTISSFDPDVFDSCINREGSFFYRHYETGDTYGNKEMTDNRIKKLMMAIFRDEILKLRVCAAYCIDFEDGNFNGMAGYRYPAGILDSHTPNQHIHHYGCLGNNRAVISDAMVRRDYVSAVNACYSSAANINLAEPNTVTYFMTEICSPNVGRIIQMPDSSTMTPVDAVKWLEAQESEKKTEEEKHEQTD